MWLSGSIVVSSLGIMWLSGSMVVSSLGIVLERCDGSLVGSSLAAVVAV